MTQTATGPAPSDSEAYFDALDAIDGMSTQQTWMGQVSVTCHYTVTAPDAETWTVDYPDGVDSAAVAHVVNP